MIIVHVVGVEMNGGVETGVDSEAGIIAEVPADDGDGVVDIGVTNQEGFKTGTVRPLDGLSMSCGSGSTNGGDLGSGAEPFLLLRGMGVGFHDGS